MAQGKTLSVKLSLNDKQFQTGLRKATRSLGKFSRSLTNTGKNLSTQFTLPIAAAGFGAIKMASAFEESLNKTRVAFGESSGVVEAFAKTTLKSFGIAEGSALEMSSLFGDMATAMGLSQEQAAGMSTTLVGLAGDLASFKDIGIEQAQTALAGIFTGETESLKKMGLLITESTLKQHGFNKSMSQSEKIAIRYKAILDQTSNAQGDYVRTSEGVANSSRTLQQTIKELATEFGMMLLPLTSKLISTFQSLTEKIKGLTDAQKETILKVAGLVAVLGPALFILGKFLGVLQSIGKTLMFLSANPMVLFITAITAFVAILGTAVLDTQLFINTALKLGNAGRLVAKGMIHAADALGLMSKPKAMAAIAAIDGLAKEEKELEKNTEDANKDLKDQLKLLTQLQTKADPSKFSGWGFKAPAAMPAISAGAVDMPSASPLGEVDFPEFPDEEILYWDEVREKVQMVTMVMTEAFEALGGVMNAIHERRVQQLEAETALQLQHLDSTHAYVKHLKKLEDEKFNNMTADEKRQHNLKKDYEEKKARIEKEAAKKKAQLDYKAAKAAKAQNIANAIISVAGAVANVLPNIPLAIMIGGLGAIQVASMIATPIPPPALADGGIAFGESLVRVGEYSGANVNPEVIAPLNKLQSMMGGNQVQVVGTISGNDIMLSNARTSIEHNQRLV